MDAHVVWEWLSQWWEKNPARKIWTPGSFLWAPQGKSCVQLVWVTIPDPKDGNSWYCRGVPYSGSHSSEDTGGVSSFYGSAFCVRQGAWWSSRSLWAVTDSVTCCAASCAKPLVRAAVQAGFGVQIPGTGKLPWLAAFMIPEILLSDTRKSVLLCTTWVELAQKGFSM